MKLLCYSFLVLTLIAGPAMAQDDPPAKPGVLILTTGGTIASPKGDPMIEGPALVQAVPQVRDHADITVEEFSLIGSSKMTPGHWLNLGKRINQAFSEDSNLRGIVVTHGTDTMEETAYFLNLTVKSDRPVVLTGAMRSPDEISADGPANLINAVRVAVSEKAVGQGVLLVLNEDINPARDVRKTVNRRVRTFGAGAGGHLGSVDPDGVEFFRATTWPHTKGTEFEISGLESLPQVAILSDYTGMDEATVVAFGQRAFDGLVVRTFAGGRMSAGMLAGLSKLKDKGIPTVVTTRVGGRIVGNPGYDFPAIVANGQPDNKARILLMLGLAHSKDLAGLQRIFDTY